MTGFDVVVLGSGFAGSILARCLNARGMRVLLVERGSHPRFALGESSTPLANLCLERLAVRYDLEDLYHQAAWGRWQENLNRQGGLKRGFTFFGHATGDRMAPRPEKSLWVAASPDERLADSQWLRSSVDSSLVSRAVSEGVRVMENTQVLACSRQETHWRLELESNSKRFAVEAGFLVDASGGARFASRHLGAGSAPAPIRTSLTFGHFGGVPEPPTPQEAPYETAWSAVHHLLEDGWMYELRFQDGSVSAGVLTATSETGALLPDPASADIRTCLAPYPWLAARYRHAVPQGSVTRQERVAYRAERAAGEGWVVLPHGFSFVDPLFATGIAWSLLGVERVARVLTGSSQDFAQYESLLKAEIDHIGRLVRSAYRNLGHFERFCTIARGYFIAASYSETCQRVLTPTEAPWCSTEAGEGWEWAAFLGADDPALARLFEQFEEIGTSMAGLDAALQVAAGKRDVAGFGVARGSYDVDLEPLRHRAELLGLSRSTLEQRLPRLFSPETLSDARARTTNLG